MSFQVFTSIGFVGFATVCVHAFDDTRQCFFNETSCACGMKFSEKRSATRLDVVGTDPGTGWAFCRVRDCEASYACM